MSTGLEIKGNLGLLVVFGDQAGSSVTGSGVCWPPNTLRLCRTRSCLLTSASRGGPKRRSFIWIFSGLMRMRGRRTAGQQNNMIAGDKIMTRRRKVAKVCHTLLCKQGSVWLRENTGGGTSSGCEGRQECLNKTTCDAASLVCLISYNVWNENYPSAHCSGWVRDRV